jgi:hypothetical protein
VPKPQDEEVQSFTLMTVDAVQKAILADEFKPDSAAVLVAFFIRRSIIMGNVERVVVVCRLTIEGKAAPSRSA